MKGTAYIAAEVKRLGLRPAGDSGSYFQNVPFIARTLDPQTTITRERHAAHGVHGLRRAAVPWRARRARSTARR